MYIYDKDTNILTVCKLNLPRPKVDLLRDIRNSYEKYLETGFEADVAYIAESIETMVNQRAANSQTAQRVDYSIGYKCHLGKKYSSNYKNELKTLGNEYYPVYATFSVNGVWGSEIELYRIPYMDRQLGILNVDSKLRVMTSALRSADDISLSLPKGEIVVTIKNKRIGIHLNKESIYFDSPYAGANKQKVSVETALNSFIIKSGESIDIRTLFSNHLIVNSMTSKKFQQAWQMEDDASKVSFYDVYAARDLKVMPYLRVNLNETLSIDASVGYVLSRNIYLSRDKDVINKGTTITTDIIKKLKYNLVNEVYIKKLPSFEKMYLAFDIVIKQLRRGCRVTGLIRDYFPEFGDYNFIPKTIDLDNPIILGEGSLVTEDILKLLESCGYEDITLATTKSGKGQKVYRFEQEFIGNNFHKVSDFVEPTKIPKEFSADDYVYIDHIDFDTYLPEVKDDGGTLTVWDFLSLTSLAARSFTMPELREVFNRDVDFLKKIDLIGDSFSLYLRISARKVLSNSKRKLQGQVANLSSSGIKQDIFFSLSSEWYKQLWDSKLLKTCDDTNPISLLTQARKVASSIGNAKEFPAEIRNISIGYFGKICPFETPESGNTGLINSLAHGCLIEEGIPKSPYYAVRSMGGNKKYISSNITYLSAKDESKVIIGDIMSLKFIDPDLTKNRVFSNSRIIARVPDYTTGNRSKLANIDSFSLDYVTAYPEQHLSLTAQLIPFAQNNDAVRDSFALSRIRQALNLQEGEPPRVMTSMYREMFDGNTNFVVRAERPGEVVSIMSENLYILYDGDEEPLCIKVPEIRISDNCVVILNYRKDEGQRFKEGEVLVDSSLSRSGVFSPGVNLLTAYACYYGYNYEDSSVMATMAQRKFVSISNDTVVEPIKVGQRMYQPDQVNRYRYVNEGDTIVEIGLVNENNHQKTVRKKIRAEKMPGIVYSIGVEQDEARKSNIVCKSMGYRQVTVGDKMCGLHANKGVISKVVEDQNMLCLANGKVIEYLPNPAGINSRMNIGQTLEAHLGLVATIFDIHIKSNGYNGATAKDISELLRMAWTACNESIEAAESKFPNVPKEVFDRARTRRQEIENWKGCFNPDGTAYIFNPKTGKFLEYPVVIGYTYYLKLIQEVDDKIHARGSAIVEPYSRMSKQPTKGSADKGGQKIGEMESASLISHGSCYVLYEMFNSKSDNVFLRELDTLRALDLYTLLLDVEEKIARVGAEPHSLTMLRYYIEAVGSVIEGDDLADLSNAEIERWEVNFKSAIMEYYAGTDDEEEVEGLTDIQKKLKEKLGGKH